MNKSVNFSVTCSWVFMKFLGKKVDLFAQNSKTPSFSQPLTEILELVNLLSKYGSDEGYECEMS